jgi:hypothetical protein
MVVFRPMESDSGPATSVPAPMPSTKVVSTSCARFTASGRELRRDLGQGGQHRVDGEGDGGEEHRDHRDELALAQVPARLAARHVGHAPSAGDCAAISAMTWSQSSGGCAPGTTWLLATTKVGTPVTPRSRAQASRARMSSASAPLS